MANMSDDCVRRRRETGQRVREWRLKHDRSQADVARAAGITQASLSNYETGKREMPLSTALGITAALDLGLADILDVEGVIVLRDARLGRAVSLLVERPELLERVVPSVHPVEAEAAS